MFVIYTRKIFYGKILLGKVSGFVVRSTAAVSGVWMPNKSNFEKIITGTWILMAFILVRAYSGNLVAMLAAPKFPIPISRFRYNIDCSTTNLCFFILILILVLMIY